jgi:hypothetical protein
LESLEQIQDYFDVFYENKSFVNDNKEGIPEG